MLFDIIREITHNICYAVYYKTERTLHIFDRTDRIIFLVSLVNVTFRSKSKVVWHAEQKV